MKQKSKIPNDLSIYTDESVKSLKDILASIEEEKKSYGTRKL